VSFFKGLLLHIICKINSVNELVLTEIVLDNTLAAYEPEEVVALLSSFVFQEKTEVEPVFPPRLEDGRDALLAISERVAAVQDRHKVAADEHRKTLNFGLMEAVYEWAKGMVSICHCLWLNDCSALMVYFSPSIS
jgi:antiviral helicase SKI2